LDAFANYPNNDNLFERYPNSHLHANDPTIYALVDERTAKLLYCLIACAGDVKLLYTIYCRPNLYQLFIMVIFDYVVLCNSIM